MAWHSMAKRPTAAKPGAAKATPSAEKKKKATGGLNPQRRSKYLGQSTGGFMETPTLQ